MQTTIEIRPMLKVHLAHVAQVHTLAFKGFFLTQMGEPFLLHYYNSVLEYQNAIALVAVDANSQIVGLAVGFKDPTEFYRHFRQYRVRMLPAIAMGLLLRPWLLLMILRNVRRVSKDDRQESRGVVELASICSIVRKQNIGTTLLEAFLLKAQDIGAFKVTLTTDQDNNSEVHKFYEWHGFIKKGCEQRGRRLLINYSISI